MAEKKFEGKRKESHCGPRQPNIESVLSPFRISPTSENERVLRKTETLELIERPVTRQPKRYVKRGCHTVRERSLTYMASLKEKYGISKEIPLEQAKRIFQEEMDIWDRTSLKAYFGTQESLSKRSIHRTAHYPTGTISHKDIELTQRIQRHEGYLERLGLVCFEKRGNTWFLLLESESVTPEIFRHTKPESDCLAAQVNMENFSLTPILSGKSLRNRFRDVSAKETKKNREERECIGRERNQSSESIHEHARMHNCTRKNSLNSVKRSSGS